MRRSALVHLFVWSLILFPSVSQADSHELKPHSLRIGLMNFPPFSFKDENAETRGSLVEMLDPLLARLGLQWKYHFHTTPHLLKSLAEGTSDISILIRHPAIEPTVLYGTQAVGELSLFAYRQPETRSVSHVDELKGQSLILIEGFGYGGLLDFFLNPDNQMQVRTAISHDAAMQMVATQPDTYLLDYEGPAEEALKRTQGIRVEADNLDRKPLYFVISRRVPKNQQLLEALESAYKSSLSH